MTAIGTEYDLFESRKRRDAALEQVRRHEFRNRAMNIVRAMPPGEYIGEDIRRACFEAGVAPHHHNAWGSFINSLVRQGILHKTGRLIQMKDVRSHARASQSFIKR